MINPNPENYNIPYIIRDFNGMPFRKLGHSGLNLSNIGLGTWKFGFPATGDGARVDAATAWSILDRAIELGVTFWDTANRYNAASGNSERVIGQWFHDNPDQRRNVVLATKVFGGMDGRTPNHCGASRANLLDATTACLKRLRLEYIDILYLHSFDPETPVEETLATIEDMTTRGWIRYFGVSNFTPDQIKLYQAAERQFSSRCRVVAVQNRFDILHGESPRHTGALELAESDGIGFVAYSPLAQGLLTERYLNPARIGTGDRLYDEKQMNQPGLPADIAKVRALKEIADTAGIKIEQLALAYLITLPGMAPCIPSSSTVEQLEANAKAGCITLNEDQIREIRRICN